MKKSRWPGVLLAGVLLLSLLPLPARAADAFAFGEDLSMMCIIDGSTLTIRPRTEDSAGEIPVFARINIGSTAYVSSPWFSYRNQIETVVVEEGVVNIPANCFAGMSGMKRIHIPLSVKEIAGDGFLYCSGLKDVYYAGLPGNWGDISISSMSRVYNLGTNTFSTPVNWLSGVTRHYADGSESGGGGSVQERGTGTVDPGSGTDGGIAFSFNASDGVLTISPGENGTMADYGLGGLPPWDKGRNLIKKIVIEDGVKNVGSGAFKDSTNLTQVQLGSTVEKLGEYAFRLCTALTGIHIPDSVARIEDDAFNCCAAMETITVGGGNQTYAAPAGVLYTKDMKTLVYYPAQRSGISYEVPEGVTAIAGVSFCDAAGLEEITLPSTLKSIGYYAFEGCGFSRVELPEGLETIAHAVFNRCFQLEEVTVPASVTEIQEGAFHRCTALKRITVDPASGSFADRDGILFSRDGTQLLCYPAGRGAPSYAVPEGVETIGVMAFKQASMLTAVGLPSSLREVGEDAFLDCSGIKDLYYAGTREQWDAWAGDEENPPQDQLIRGVGNGGNTVIVHWNTPMPDLPQAAIPKKTVTKGEDGGMIYSFTVTTGRDDAAAWFAVYATDGRFLGVESRPLTEGKNELSFSPADGDALTYKLLVLSDDGSAPLCPPFFGDLYGSFTAGGETDLSA